MEIKTHDNKVIKTQNLTDVDAMLLEAMVNLSEMCEKYNRKLFVVIEARSEAGNYLSSCQFNNETHEKAAKELNTLFSAVNYQVLRYSSGRYSIQPNQ